MAKHAVYIRFSSETNFESLRFTSHNMNYDDIIDHLQKKKNVKVGPDKDEIELIDALRKTKYSKEDGIIDPGTRIIIKRYPGTKLGEINVKNKKALSKAHLEESKDQILDPSEDIQSNKDSIEDEKTENLKVMKLQFDLPEKVINNRKKEDDGTIVDTAGKIPTSHQVPDECLCDICQCLLLKPFILTCCTKSVCKMCEMSKFNLEITPK